MNYVHVLAFYSVAVMLWFLLVLCVLFIHFVWTSPWWRHQMETFFALALCETNPPFTGGFFSQRPVIRCFDVFVDLRLNKRLSNNRGAGDLRHYCAHYDVTVMHGGEIILWYMGKIHQYPATAKRELCAYFMRCTHRKPSHNDANFMFHCSEVIVSAISPQITGVLIVYSTVCSGADQRKHQSSAWLVFVWGIYRWPVDSLHRGPVTRKMFLFDYVIMI